MFEFAGVSTRKYNPDIRDESLWVTQKTRRVVQKQHPAVPSGMTGGAMRWTTQAGRGI